MTPHSSTLAWKIPWTEEPGVAKSQTRLSDFAFTFHFHALEKEMATHSCLENPRDGGAWWAALSLGFSRQEHWSGLPFPPPVHESEK